MNTRALPIPMTTLERELPRDGGERALHVVRDAAGHNLRWLSEHTRR